MVENQSQTAEGLRVLIVDDDQVVTNILRRLVRKLGCNVQTTNDAASVGGALVSFDPEVIFLDLMMPEVDGIEVIEMLGKSGCGAGLVLMSGLEQKTVTSIGEIARRNKLNLIAAITKPFQAEQIESLLRPLIQSRSEAQEVAADATGTQAITLAGPLLELDRETRLGEGGDDSVRWYRITSRWLLDNDEVVDLEKTLDREMAKKCAGGLLNLELMLLNVRLSDGGVSKAESGFRIPVKPALFEDSQVPDLLARLASLHEFVPGRLSFEVRESMLGDESTDLLNQLSRLKIKGFQIGVCVQNDIDRVLRALKMLPVDELVLDMAHERYRKKIS